MKHQSCQDLQELDIHLHMGCQQKVVWVTCSQIKNESLLFDLTKKFKRKILCLNIFRALDKTTRQDLISN